MRRLAMLLCLALLACEGPTGPEGPPGPQGEQGPPGADGQDGQDGQDGAAFHVVRTGRLDSQGSTGVDLGPEAGTLANPPVVSCWVSSEPDGAYLQIATDLQGAACGIVFSDVTNTLAVAIVNAPAFWYYIIVAVK